ncbi:hypothetical protein FACS1894160_0890 [Bacteroidia bacterium]|nr:hypothetical protein FACS1894160_0890 [Bacteroidia bacterium]
MKTAKFYFLTSALLLGTLFGANAQTLTEIYSGSKLPTEEGWTEWRLDSSVRPEAGEVLGELKEGAVRLWAADGDYTQLGYYKVNQALNPETGYTVEIKAKVTDASEYGAFVVQGYTPDGNGFRLGIYKTYLAASTNPVAPKIVLAEGLDNSDFHTYRVAVTKADVTVYRDGTKTGTFPVIKYIGDNLIANGGFEDFNGKTENENADEKFIGNGWSVSGGLWERSQGEDGRNDAHGGSYGAYVSSKDAVGLHPTYRPIPLKPDATYDWSVWFKNHERVQAGNPEGNGWRDFNGWFNSVDNGGSRQVYEHREDFNVWGFRQGNFKSAEDRQRYIIDIPCVGDPDSYNISAYDEITLRERVPEAKFNAVLPDNFVNLIPNGDFEDEEANKQYATCFEDPCPEWSEMWGARVRLQTDRQPGNDEAGPFWARSGQNSLRYFNCFGNDVEFGGDFFMQEDGRGKNCNLNFQHELEAGKTYTFGFWYHFAQWGGDHFTLQVKNGEDILWSKVISNADFPEWINKVFTFTTNEFSHTLKLQTVRDGGTPGLIYFDDFVLFEGEPVSVTTPEPITSFLFFGKATGTESTDVEIQKVSYSTSGAYAPDGSKLEPTYNKYIEISTPEEFNNIRNNLDGFYRLTADIDLSGYENFEPIGVIADDPFTGELQGDFHEISGLTISREAGYQGLFGYARDAVITKLIIKDAIVQGGVTGGQNVGILFGRGQGITVDQVAIIESTVWGWDHVGALGGITESGGKTSHISNVYIEGGSVNTAEHQAGGILGIAKNTLLENSYFTGYVASAEVDGRDAGGIVSRTEDDNVELRGVISLASEITGGRTGQFIPYGNAFKIADCFARDDMNIPNEVGTKATEDQLLPLSDFKTKTLYTDIGWDFDNIWKIEAGQFPVFKNTTTAIKTPSIATEQNLRVLKSASNTLLLRVNNPATVYIYNTTGVLVNRLDVQRTANVTLPHGIYIVKSVSNKTTETIKVVN